MANNDLLYRIIGDSSSGVDAVNKFGRAVEGVSSESRSNLTRVSAIAGAVGGAVAEVTRRVIDSVASLASEAVIASDATDKFKQTLNFAGVDDGTISSLTDQTKAYADRTVYDLTTIQNTTAQLAANSVPDYANLTEAAGNLNAVAGGNAETFRSVSMAVTQTAGAGRLMTENWNQLADAIPGASGRLQEAMLRNGAFTGNFREAMEKGEITAEEFNRALMELGTEPIAVEAAQSTTTFEGALGGLQATIVGGIAGMLDTLKPMLTGGINTIASGVGGFFTWFDGAFQGILALAGQVPSALGVAFGWIVTAWSSVSDEAGRLWTALLSLVPALIGLWQAVSPVMIILQILGPELPAIAASFLDIAVAVTELATSAIATVLPMLSTLVGWLVDASIWLTQNHTIVLALAAAWLTWRGIATVIGIVRAAQIGYAAATYGSTAATYANTAATQAQAIAARAGAAAVALQNTTLYRSIAAWVANTAAVATNSSLTLSTKAAIIASSIATGIATAAQWAWNAALTANPIGVVVMAIAALVGGLIWFFTQTELGQEVWTNVTNAISTAVTWLWENVLSPVFTAIGAIFTWLYENIIIPVVTGVMLYIGLWAAIYTWLWQTVLAPVFAAIGEVFTWIYNTIIVPIVNGIIAYVQLWAAIFTWLWVNVLQPTFAALGAGFAWLWDNVVRPVASFISDAIRNIGNVVSSVFGGIAGFIGSAFQSVLGVVRGPLNALIDLINGVIGGLNSIRVDIPDWVPMVGGQTFGLSIPRIPKLATGGVTTQQTLAIIGDNPGGREVVEPLESYQSQARDLALAAAAQANGGGGDRPIYADGIGLIGVVREVAGQEAQLVWNIGEAQRTQMARMGRQRSR